MAKPPATLTEDEVTRLVGSFGHVTMDMDIGRKLVRNYTMIVIMLDAGLRVGELVRLRVSDLFYNSVPVNTIIITPVIARKGAVREIPVSERLSTALKLFWGHCTGHTSYYAAGYIFHGASEDNHMTTRQVERIVRTQSQYAIGRAIHPHVLRHTFASRLMRRTNMRVVQQLLGHKRIASTQIYTHPNNEDCKKAIDAL